MILFITFAIRLIYHFSLHPPLTWSDARLYDGSAWNLINGFGYSYPRGEVSAAREPGYALFFLVPVYYFFGHSILAAQIIQIILSAGVVLLIYFLAGRFFNKKIALLAALIYSLWPADIVFGQEILTEIPAAFLFLIFVILLVLGIKNESAGALLASGLILGAATLTRFTTILLPFAILFIFVRSFKTFKTSFKFIFLFFIGFLILVSPWFVRNYIHFNQFVFGRTGAGSIYWSGSYIPGDGEWLGPETPTLDDAAFKREAIKNIKENPLGVLEIWMKKPFKIFFRTAAYGHRFHSSDILLNLVLIGGRVMHVLVICLSILGLIFSYKNERNKILNQTVLVIVAYFSIVLLPMNPDPRYQIPLMPYFIIFASVGIWRLIEMVNPCLNRVGVAVRNDPPEKKR